MVWSNGKDPSDDGAQRAVVDEGCDLAELVAAGAHEQELVAHAEPAGLAADPAAEAGDREAQHRVQAGLAGERRVRGAGDPDGRAAGPEHAHGLLEVLPAEAVQHQVVTGEELLEVLGAVVDDRVGAELADEVRVGGPGRGGDGRAEVLCELDRDRPDPACTAVDEDLLPRLHVPALHERLPRRQRDQRQRARLLHGDRRGLERQIGLGHGDALGERTDAVLVGPGVDLVAGLEPAHLRADADDGAGDIVAEYQRQRVRQDLLELAEADLLIELVQPGRFHPHKHVMLSDHGLRDVGLLQRLLVLGDDERPHGMVLLRDDPSVNPSLLNYELPQ